jgi:hypothetical protein
MGRGAGSWSPKGSKTSQILFKKLKTNSEKAVKLAYFGFKLIVCPPSPY